MMAAFGKVPALQNVAHYRAPYKNAYLSGFGDDAQALAAISTVGPDGVRVLSPAAAIAILNNLTAMSVVPFTQSAQTLQVFANDTRTVFPQGVQPGTPTAADWANAELAKGRSVLVSTNIPGGLATLTQPAFVAPDNSIVLVSTSSKADEAKAAATGAALLQASKLKAPLHLNLPQPVAKASLAGPIGVALVSLAVVGGIWWAFGRKKTQGRRRYEESYG